MTSTQLSLDSQAADLLSAREACEILKVKAATLYTYVSRVMRRMGLIDVAGVFHTFGVPGVIGGLLSAIFRARYYDRGGIQVAGTFISLGISLVGGLVVGVVIRFLGYFIVEDEYYNDMSKVYFDDVADFHSNPNPYYETQRRVILAPNNAGYTVPARQVAFDAQKPYEMGDREGVPVL